MNHDQPESMDGFVFLPGTKGRKTRNQLFCIESKYVNDRFLLGITSLSLMSVSPRQKSCGMLDQLQHRDKFAMDAQKLILIMDSAAGSEWVSVGEPFTVPGAIVHVRRLCNGRGLLIILQLQPKVSYLQDSRR